MILDVNPTPDMEQQILTNNTGENGNTISPETPKEEIVDPDSEGNIKIVQDGKVVKIELPTILIQGQLGKLLTNQLNKTFHQEERGDEIGVSKLEIDVPEGNELKLSNEGYIYATSIECLNVVGAKDLLTNLLPAKEMYKNVVCYIENDAPIKVSLDLAIECLEKEGIKVLFNYDKLVSVIENFND